MNNSIFLRLVWKEYRLQRALWISMVLLTGMLMFIVHLFALDETERFSWQLLLGLSMPALYCVGLGAILFAGEREAETYEFQRSLPVGAARMFAAKMTFAALGVATMFGLFWAALLILRPAGAFEPVQMAHTYSVEVAKRMPLFGIVLLLWTIFFSLRLRKVLLAAVLGVVVGSFYFDISSGWWCKLWGDFRIAWELIVLTAAIALVDVWFGLRWFRQRKERRREPGPSGAIAGLSSSEQYAVVQTNCEPIPVSSDRLIILGRLVWQHWRQSSRLIMVLVGLTLLPLVMIGVGWLATGELPNMLWNNRIIQYAPIAHMCGITFGIFPAILGVALLGLTAFHSDQWGRGYRFLADRGMPPKYVWLSRQLICWTAAVAVLPGLLVAMFFLTPAPAPCPGPVVPIISFYIRTCEALIGYVILSVAVGQFLSMFFRSGILAGLFSIILTTILAAWCGLMWLWGVNWLWSMLPIPLALLLATRLRVRDWLLERNTPRAWFRPGLALAIPTAVLLIAVPMYRVYQIPYIDPGFSPDEFAREMTPEEQATLAQYKDMLREADSQFYSMGNINSLTTAEQAGRENLLVLAVKVSHSKIYDPTGQLVDLLTNVPFLSNWLIKSANNLEEHGELNQALERYLAAIRLTDQYCDWCAHRPDDHTFVYVSNTENIVFQRLKKWAVRPDQTPERLLAAERQLKQITAGFTPNTVIKLRYPLFRRFIEGDPSALVSASDEFQTQSKKYIAYMLSLPWERARCLRLLNLATRHELDLLENMEQHLEAGKPLDFPIVVRLPDHWSKPSLLNVIQAPDCCMYYQRPFDIYQYIRTLVALEANRRATRIILALEAWKLQHGSLPKKLDELVGTCIEKLPNDPYTGQPFRYFPDGVKHSFSTETKQNDFLYDTAEISAGEPFLWAAGPNVKLRQYIGVGQEIDLHRYAVRDAHSDQAEWHMPITENKIWASGLVFPIP